MRPFWSSLPKRKYFIGLIFCLLFLAAIQSIISYTINLKASRVAEDLSEALKQKVSIKGITYGMLKDIEIEDLSVGYLKIERLQVKPRVLTSIGNKKIVVGKVVLIKAFLHIPAKEPAFNLFNIFDADFNRIIEDKFKNFKFRDPFPQLIIHDCKIVYGARENPALTLDLKGKTKVSGYNQFSSKGNFQVIKDFKNITALEGIFPDGIYKQDLGYELEVWQEGKDLVISDVKIKIGFDLFSGSGRIIDFMAKERKISLGIGLNSFSLENITLAKDSFSLNGPLALNLFLYGSPDNLAFRISTNFLGCGFKDTKKDYKIIFKSGSLILTNKSLELKDAVCTVNDRAFKANIDYYPLKENNQTYFAAKLSDETNRYLALNFQGEINPKALSGDLNLAINTGRNYRCSLANLSLKNFGHWQDGEIEAGKIIFSSPESEKFILDNLRLTFLARENYLKLENISGQGYDGSLQGSAQGRFEFGNNLFGYNLNLDLKDMNIAKLEEDLFNKQTISGKFKAEILADSNQEPRFKINAKISEGIIQNVPLLNDLADFMRFEAIRSIPFQELDFSRLDYSTGDKAFNFNLTNPDMSLISRFHTDKQDNLKGYLSVLMYKKLLEKSDNFRRLLNFVKERSNSLTFEFDLGGRAGAPRFLWRKSDFRTKLMQQLPGFIKRSLEESINEEINQLFEGKSD